MQLTKLFVSNNTEHIPACTPEEALAYLENASVFIIDVREKAEINLTGKIPGAINIPLGKIECLLDIAAPRHPYWSEFADETRYLFYCTSGKRSATAVREARKLGVTAVAHIEGGFNAWQAAQGPIQRPHRVGSAQKPVTLDAFWKLGRTVGPQSLVEQLEQGLDLPAGEEDRFLGYGVIGLPFASGHILGLRRFPTTSIGPGYTSVWYRTPAGRWIFYQDVPPDQGCTRYFGRAVSAAIVRDIDITGSGGRDFSVKIGDGQILDWQFSLAETPVTRLMNGVGSFLPDRLWRKPAVLKLLGGAASLLMGAGRLGLTGRSPNQQQFQANPRLVWLISTSRATVNGQELGPMGPAPVQANLGDLWIPQRGIFFVGMAFLEAYQAGHHPLTTTQAVAV